MLSSFEFLSIRINSFVFFNMLAFFMSFLVIYIRFKQEDYLKHYLPSIMMITFGGFVGSKIYYIFEELDLFLNDPITVFFSFHGSGFLGGFLLSYILFFFYSKKNNIKLSKLLNLISLCLPVGIFFGRFACLMAGDGCYGTPTNLPWAMTFPEGSLPTLISVHPTPIYEMILNILILYIMLFFEKRMETKQYSFVLFLFMFATYRFFIEFIRLNEVAFLGFTAPQIISIFLIAISIFILKRGQKDVKIRY